MPVRNWEVTLSNDPESYFGVLVFGGHKQRIPPPRVIRWYKVIVQTCRDLVAITLKQQKSLGWLLMLEPLHTSVPDFEGYSFWRCCVFWTTTCIKTIYSILWDGVKFTNPTSCINCLSMLEGRFAGSKQTQRDGATTAKLGLKSRFVWSNNAVEVVLEILKQKVKPLKSCEVWDLKWDLPWSLSRTLTYCGQT